MGRKPSAFIAWMFDLQAGDPLHDRFPGSGAGRAARDQGIVVHAGLGDASPTRRTASDGRAA